MMEAVKHYFKRIFYPISTCLLLPPAGDLAKKARWFFVRLVLAAAVVMLILDTFIPIMGNIYLKPRRQTPPKLPPGLSLVDTVESTLPTSVDVIFVHGLGSFPDTTWRKKRPLGPNINASDVVNVSWIRDLLPDDLPQGRLMYFNYDSTSYNDAPQKELQDFGMDLLNAFQVSELRITEQEKARPIIFLSHSYGGVVVKEALVQASHQPDRYSDLLNNVKGLVFLGTPHFGTQYAKYARAAAIRLDRLGSNPDIFLPLEVNSSQLLELHQEYLERYRDLDVVNLFETRKQTLFRTPFGRFAYKIMVVEKSSATFKAPNTTNDSIDTDHSGLNKFDSPNDQGYVKILFYLKSMTRKIIRQRRLQKEKDELLAAEGNNAIASPKPVNCPSISRYVVRLHTVKSFTQRVGLMTQITRSLDDVVEGSDPPRSLALWGIGGAGKTQLALRYLELNRDRYDPIIWINAENPDTAAKSYADAFEALDLDFPAHAMDEFRKDMAQKSQKQYAMQTNWVVKAVLHWLAHRQKEHCEWLVVLDGADDLTWIPDILPRGIRGSIIITSRDQRVDMFTNHAINVGMMTTEEAVELLFRGARPHSDSPANLAAGSKWRTSQEQQALGIVNILGHLPFAIDLAGAYIADNDYVRENLSHYMDYLAEKSFDLLNTEEPTVHDQYGLQIATVWETSFVTIQKSHPYSATALLLLAHLNHASIEDRLFSEASLRLVELQDIASPGKYFVLFLAISGLVFAPKLVVFLILKFMPWRPELVSHRRRTAFIFLATSPVILDIVGLTLIAIIRARRIQTGDTVRPIGIYLDAEDIVIIVFCSIGYTIPTIAEWLLQNNPWPIMFRLLVPIYTTVVLLGWVWARFWETASTAVEQHIKTLLSRLDFSETSMRQFILMLGGLHRASSQEFGWRFLLDLAWHVFWSTVVQCIVTYLSIMLCILWDVLISAVVKFLEHRDQKFILKVIKWFFIFMNSQISHLLLMYSFGFWVGCTGITYWQPWQKKKKEYYVGRGLLNYMLSTTDEDQWNRRPYSEIMSPITRLSLMQRNPDQSYAMHPLVQWWARQRIPMKERKAWVREAERFLELVYQSKTCWKDISCQQIVIPHLIEIASADAVNSEGRFWTLKYFLNMLYRSLKLVGDNTV